MSLSLHSNSTWYHNEVFFVFYFLKRRIFCSWRAYKIKKRWHHGCSILGTYFSFTCVDKIQMNAELLMKDCGLMHLCLLKFCLCLYLFLFSLYVVILISVVVVISCFLNEVLIYFTLKICGLKLNLVPLQLLQIVCFVNELSAVVIFLGFFSSGTFP